MCKIKYIIIDVDGTLTDGKIYMGDNGELMKAFNIKDGYAISHILPQNNIVPIIITGRNSEIVNRRCCELGITEVYQGHTDKKKTLFEIARKYEMKCVNGILDECAVIGDDVLDMPIMKMARYTGCPLDASKEVRMLANYVCKQKGGEGAVREFVEEVVRINEKEHNSSI